MKIYFAASIRGGHEDVAVYREIIQHLENYGQVLTNHIGDEDLAADRELTDRQIYERDIAWLKESDVMVAEVTTPSLGVGFEIGTIFERNKWARNFRKDILCLYRPQGDKRLSAMISGCLDITVFEYNNIEEAKQVIDEFFKS